MDQFGYVAFRGMKFIVGKYMVITCEVNFAVGNVLAHVCKNDATMCIVSIIAL